jgi:hypothetical protein
MTRRELCVHFSESASWQRNLTSVCSRRQLMQSRAAAAEMRSLDRTCRSSELPVQLRFRDATAADAPVIAAQQNAAAGALTARFGDGHWSSFVTERGAVLAQRHARVRVGARTVVQRFRRRAGRPQLKRDPLGEHAPCPRSETIS